MNERFFKRPWMAWVLAALLLPWAVGCAGSSSGSDGDAEPSDGDSADTEMEPDGEDSPDGDMIERDAPENGETESEFDSPLDGDAGESESPEEGEETENDAESAEADTETIPEIDPDDIGDADYEQDPQGVVLNGPCSLDNRVGGFKVEMNEDAGYTAIDGAVRNGVIPGQVPDVAFTEGDCRLLRRRRLVCNPVCEPGTTCGFDETCIPMPLGQDMGTVVFRGLVKPVVLEPIQPGNTYFYTRLSHPGFQNNVVIQMATSPGYMGALELYGVGVARLVAAESTWTITENEPLVIHWTPPEEGARSSVYVEINIDVHGATPLNLVCDLPDTGEATLGTGIINQFIGAGVTGYPTGKVIRRTVDSVTVADQCMEFVVSSVRTIHIEVAGHVPCSDDDDCPEPLTCNTEIQQCQ